MIIRDYVALIKRNGPKGVVTGCIFRCGPSWPPSRRRPHMATEFPGTLGGHPSGGLPLRHLLGLLGQPKLMRLLIPRLSGRSSPGGGASLAGVVGVVVSSTDGPTSSPTTSSSGGGGVVSAASPSSSLVLLRSSQKASETITSISRTTTPSRTALPRQTITSPWRLALGLLKCLSTFCRAPRSCSFLLNRPHMLFQLLLHLLLAQSY